MTLKIKRTSEDDETRLCLSGELRAANVADLRNEVAKTSPRVILDLTEVDVVDIDGIRWLIACQTVGVQIDNCAPYICEWMRQEKT